MKMKYKPCCGSRCCLGSCEIRDNGGCYCLCRLFDQLSQAKSIIDGHTIICGPGTVYYPNIDDAKKHLERLRPEDRKQNDDFVKNCNTEMKNIEEKIKFYEY